MLKINFSQQRKCKCKKVSVKNSGQKLYHIPAFICTRNILTFYQSKYTYNIFIISNDINYAGGLNDPYEWTSVWIFVCIWCPEMDITHSVFSPRYPSTNIKWLTKVNWMLPLFCCNTFRPLAQHQTFCMVFKYCL